MAARQLLEAAYLRPLRDAEREMSPGPGSRLSQVLNRFPGIVAGGSFDIESPPESMADARGLSLSAMVEYLTHLIHQHDGVTTAEATINKDYLANLALAGEKLQGKLNFIYGGTEAARLRQILERLQLDLLEAPTGTAKGKYGLGSNNLLYMACELLLLGKESIGFPLLLIEEPEAHLHPQRQLRLMQFLESATRSEIPESRPVQVILTTHSPNLSSKIPLDNIVILEGQRAFSLAAEETKLQRSDYRFLERFLDVTKANLFFARGLLIVEGDAEAILLPALARLIGRNLTEHGVSIVNVGGTGLRRYGRIMQRKDDAEAQLSVPVACLADMDVMPDCAPATLELVTGNDDEKWTSSQRRWKAKRDFGDAQTPQEAALAARRADLATGDGEGVRTFVSDHWTFEYDLAYAGLTKEVYVAARLAQKDEAICGGKKDVEAVAAAAAADFDTLAAESAGDNEQLCSHIYALFGRDKVSKAVAAQYLVEILDGKIDGGTKSSEPLRQRLPAYVVAAIDFASRADGTDASTPGGR
jgi:putative ATP-dependent endonuclease of OLD family